MNAIVTRAKSFLRSDVGPTTAEYAVILTLVVVAVVAATRPDLIVNALALLR